MMIKQWELHTKTLIKTNGGVKCIPSSVIKTEASSFYKKLVENRAPPIPSSIHNGGGKNTILKPDNTGTPPPPSKQLHQIIEQKQEENQWGSEPVPTGNPSPTILESYTNNINLEPYGVEMIL